MKPYFQDEFVTLYHGDCLENPELWTGADVLVTDPPYGMGYESNFNRLRRKGVTKVGRPVVNDNDTRARDRVLEMWGCGPALVFGRWNLPRPSAVRQRLVWDRGYHGMGDLSMPWGPGEEEIYVLGEGWKGQRTSNVIRAHALMSNDSRRPAHPTPKPVGLMESLIEKCPPGLIADPFAGSGSTLVAARNLGRRAIGVEIEERYCEIAAKRLSQQVFDFSDLEECK